MAFNLHLEVITSDTNCLDIPDVISDSFDGTYWKFSTARNHLRDIINQIISERVSSKKEYGDYLDALLSEEKKHDIQEIRDMLMVLFLAGRDSTLGTFIWGMYELCRNPEWISLLRKEIEMVGTGDNVILFKEVEKYHLHRAVLFETLRLWPGLPKNARVAMEDDVLPAIDASNLPTVNISKGDFVLWSDYSLMRSSEVWGPDAEKFNPGRHIDSNRKFVAPKAPKFHGFGFGPRSCPGETLSTYEFVSIISLIIRDFDIVPLKVQPEGKERALVEALSSFMDGPFYVTVKLREETMAN
ncbi:hypothetical protein Clacol_004968 [Clathrus columnatus]|uniref:Cytochrome P450 n=1 Tax=Clathrus columnatus TaxID=1419009 RepID=A0AAV5A7Z1_9AGAM|nr:hypothetical protein Clacol_004968 [Clathrus columnatus]